MSIWVSIPTAREHGGTLPLWKARGYCVAAFLDAGSVPLACADLCVVDKYISFTNSVNHLIRLVAAKDPEAQWFVVAGDDIDPDAHAPEEIAKECVEHFSGTFGVMQPTGDRWCIMDGTCASERVCDSPWIGREYALRANQGQGAYCEAYFHFFCDEELHEVAKQYDLLWHRPDLYHTHHHWSREGKPRPPHLHPAKLNWAHAKSLYQQRKDAKFPGHEFCSRQVS